MKKDLEDSEAVRCYEEQILQQTVLHHDYIFRYIGCDISVSNVLQSFAIRNTVIITFFFGTKNLLSEISATQKWLWKLSI